MARSCKPLWVVALCLLWFSCRAEEAALPELKLFPQDRLLIFAPHPDDEVIGCGGVIQKALAMKLPLRVVFLTNGDNNEWSFALYRKHPVIWPGSVRAMGTVRHNEALAATGLFGLASNQLTFLGYPDHGTLAIWQAHWDEQPAYRALLTRAKAVPYAFAFRPGAPYKGEAIVADLETIIRDFRPTKVFVSHPADVNGDHRALYLFAQIALWGLPEDLHPAVYPYLVHYKRWPRPRGFIADEPLRPPVALRTEASWCEVKLSPEQVQTKQAALRAHRSQFGYSKRYLLSFVRGNELFGNLPVFRVPTLTTTVPVLNVEPATAAAPQEELTDAERAMFVGVEKEFISVDESNLIVRITLTRPLAKEVEASVYMFGYRSDQPFGGQPKLHVRVGEFGTAVYDQGRKLPRQTVEVTRDNQEIRVRISLAALGRPERVLTSTRTYIADLPLDWTPWRILELNGLP